MSYPINYPTPQGANIQIFNGQNETATGHIYSRTWVKPQGASFVWFTLIGAGGTGGLQADGGNGGGGGSGAVTNFMCPAFLIPNDLQINIGSSDNITSVVYQQKDGTGYTLLTANNGTAGNTDIGGAGGTAMTANYFTPIGFFQSVAGQNGASNGSISASSTTFLSGGAGSGGTSTGNYGYTNAGALGRYGFFMMQPIIVGVSNTGNISTTVRARSAVGCGGSGANDNTGFLASAGGPGMVVIITW